MHTLFIEVGYAAIFFYVFHTYASHLLCYVPQKESPKHDVERLILQAGGVKSLIGCLHGISAIHKAKSVGVEASKPRNGDSRSEKPFPIPDGLPKTAEEIEEEESARMPDSQFTRMLRARGTYPAWYSPAPDHETD